jgi:3-dehydroquinate synthetase
LVKFWGDDDIRDVMVDFYNSNDYFLDKFIELLKKDKKNTQTHLGLILSKEPGDVFKQEVLPDDNFKSILREYSKQK